MLATLSLCPAAPAVDADCGLSGLTARPVTAALPADDGIVIAALPDHAGKLDPGDAALKHPSVLEGVNKSVRRRCGADAAGFGTDQGGG